MRDTTDGAAAEKDSTDFPTHFDFAATEPALTAAWDKAGIFRAQAERTKRLGGDRDPFTVLIPPPNVTAVLHVGHGLNNTVQDVIVRWRRMAGDEALWVLQGRVRVSVGDESWELAEGDAIHYVAALAHAYSNASREFPAVLIWAATRRDSD